MIGVHTPTMGARVDHGSRVIQALEALWGAVRREHPDVPPVVVITGSAHQQIGTGLYSRTRGHYGRDLWAGPAGAIPELFIAGELLHPLEGHPLGHRVLETLLHEAAHGLAHARGIKDTSRSGNRYHNRRYAALATELGLDPPLTPDGRGWSECTLAPGTPAVYADALEVLADATLPYMPDPWARLAPSFAGVPTGEDAGDPDGGAGQDPPQARPVTVTPPARRPRGSMTAGRAGSRLTIMCQCDPPRRLAVTPHQHERAPILCGACEAAFDPTE